MTIESLDRKTGSVTRSETTLDQPLTANNAVVSALVFLNSPVDEVRDPSFNLVFRGVRYSVRREVSLDKKGDWVTQRDPLTVHLRFETSSVRLLSLIESGVPWSDIEKKYVDPKLDLANAQWSREASVLLDIATDLIIGLLLKGL